MKNLLACLVTIGFVSLTVHAQNTAQPAGDEPANMPHGADANHAKTVKPETKEALKPLEKAADQKNAATPEKKKTKKKKKQQNP